MINVEGQDPQEPSMHDRYSELVRRCSGDIWGYLLSGARNMYHIDPEDLVDDTDEEFKERIAATAIILNSEEVEVVDFMVAEGKQRLEDEILSMEPLLELINLEGIYKKHTITVLPTEHGVRLGALSTGITQEATILVGKTLGDHLNFRNAISTLCDSLGDPQEDNSRTCRVPGILALRAVSDYLMEPIHELSSHEVHPGYL